MRAIRPAAGITHREGERTAIKWSCAVPTDGGRQSEGIHASARAGRGPGGRPESRSVEQFRPTTTADPFQSTPT